MAAKVILYLGLSSIKPNPDYVGAKVSKRPQLNLYGVELMGVELLGGFLERVVPCSA
jgi:hypothetical protein